MLSIVFDDQNNTHMNFQGCQQLHICCCCCWDCLSCKTSHFHCCSFPEIYSVFHSICLSFSASPQPLPWPMNSHWYPYQCLADRSSLLVDLAGFGRIRSGMYLWIFDLRPLISAYFARSSLCACIFWAVAAAVLRVFYSWRDSVSSLFSDLLDVFAVRVARIFSRHSRFRSEFQLEAIVFRRMNISGISQTHPRKFVYFYGFLEFGFLSSTLVCSLPPILSHMEYSPHLDPHLRSGSNGAV